MTIFGGVGAETPPSSSSEGDPGPGEDHQLLPRSMVVGGGHKNRFSVPYDFWATLEVKINTDFSPPSVGVLAVKKRLMMVLEGD